MKTTCLIGLFSVLATPLLAQTQPETGAGNPTLSCKQFLEMDEAAQQDAIATLMTVGSNEMPPADAGKDSGDVGNMTSSDAAAAPDGFGDGERELRYRRRQYGRRGRGVARHGARDGQHLPELGRTVLIPDADSHALLHSGGRHP